jgi:tetratricopeptide (TPR) repeat protein
MPFEDDRGLSLSTRSAAARDACCDGVRRLLAARPGIETALHAAIEADPDFALAHAALARAHQIHGRGAQARETMGKAVALAHLLPERERSHVDALARVVGGDAIGALAAIEAHLARWPRDVMVMAPCTGVFGLFGFSGRAGREQALAAFLEPFAASLADDPWYLAMRAFARCEIGEIGAALADVERSLALEPDSAHTVHILAHVRYEAGDDAGALADLRAWLASYPREAMMHLHLHWHVALSALALGDHDAAWATYRTTVAPGAAWGPPLNLITDAASFLMRAALAGEPVEPVEWRELAALAQRLFPMPGIAFADAHVALALAMCGDHEALARLRGAATGPAADVVAALAEAFGAFANDDMAATLRALAPVLATHERLGGSRAQRDLVEQLAWVAIVRGGLDNAWRPRPTRALPARMPAPPAGR